MNETFLHNLWLTHGKILIGGVALALLAMSSVVDVDETEQAVVMRMGDPVRVINRFQPNTDYGQTGAGLSLRIPFFEQLVRIDRRVLAVEMDKQEVISSDQRKLDVDAFARIRIIDPVKMVSTAGSSDRVVDQLRPILTSQLRQQLNAHTFQSLLTPERAAVMGQIRAGLDKETRAYGVQVLDVRIVSADLPAGSPMEAVFAKMQAARGQLATAIRAQGHKQETIVEADADAEAARIYANAFNKDPAFYDFYRAMQSYEITFNPANKSGTTIVLPPDNDYLRQFRSGGKGQ